MIDAAKSRDLPLVIHQRNAFGETISVLKEENVPHNLPFVFHCFCGSLKEADLIIKAGGCVSLTGILTFKNAKELRETAKGIPLEKIMLETDSPYLAPEPKRGKTNRPAYVQYVARELADIKGSSFEEIALQTTKNACEFFGIQRPSND